MASSARAIRSPASCSDEAAGRFVADIGVFRRAAFAAGRGAVLLGFFDILAFLTTHP
jgi:hypothetical protein